MKNLKRNIYTIKVMTVAFTKRYFRDRVALFFTLIFPLIFLLIFGTIFGGSDGPNFSVVFINKSSSEFATKFVTDVGNGEIFKLDQTLTFEQGEEKLGRGEIDAIIVLPEDFGVVGANSYPEGNMELYYDKSDEQLSLTLQAILQGTFDEINASISPVVEPFTLEARAIQTADVSRFDYTLAGLIGFSLISLGIFGMSEGFSGDKKAGALRRMQVSPIKVWQLVTATAINRVFIGLLSVGLMFIVALTIFDFNMRGDYLNFILFTIISTICVFGFGMAIAGWAKDANQAAPIANLVTFPMLFLSGVFFPVFLMPEFLQNITFFIPLTPIVDGLRLILTEGYTLFDLGPQLAVIGGWTVIIYAIAFRVFSWE